VFEDEKTSRRGIDIALIQPPITSAEAPPLAPALLKSYLAKNGLSAKVFDLNVLLYGLRHGPYSTAWDFRTGAGSLVAKWSTESFVRDMFRRYSSEVLGFVHSVLTEKPRAIGFSVHLRSFTAARILAMKFRELSPETAIVFGGPQVARYSRHWKGLLESGTADAVVFGEGEESLVQYLRAGPTGTVLGVARREPGGTIVVGGPRPPIGELDALPDADFSDFNLAAYTRRAMIPIYFSRGCINDCSFCSEIGFAPKFTCRSGRRVFDEVVRQLTLYPEKTHFALNDSATNADMKQLEAFCDFVIKSGIKISFFIGNALIREEMDARFYAKLKKAGCSGLQYGLETPSKRLLDSIGKKTTRRADIDKVVSDGTRAGLAIWVNMIFGLPGERTEDFESQLAFLRKHESERDRLRLGGLSLCRFPAGSAVHEDAAKHGVDLSLGDVDWTELDGSNTFLDRVKKFETFVAEAWRFGYRNQYSVAEGDELQADELLGNHFLRKGDGKQALRHLRRSHKAESMTVESAGRILSVYAADSTIERDDYYEELVRFTKTRGSDARSDFDEMCSRPELDQYLGSARSVLAKWRNRFMAVSRRAGERLSADAR